MFRATTLTRARSIASVDYRRAVRRLRARPGQVVVLLVLVVPLSVLAPFGLVGFGGYVAGTAIRSGTVADPVAAARPLVALSWWYLLFCGTIAGASRYGRLDCPAVELPAAPLRTVVLGRLFAAGLAVFAVGGLPLALAIGTYGVGARALATPLTMAVTAAIMLAFGTVVGYALGIGGMTVVTQRTSGQVRTGLLLVAGVAYGYVMVFGQATALVDLLVDTTVRSPIGWGADLALFGASDASPFRALGFLVATGVPVLVAWIVLPTLAVARWVE